MAETLFEYAVKFLADDKDVDDKVKGVKGKLDGLTSFLGGVGKVGAAAFAAVGTATVAMGKQAVDAFANYEQLAGGITKLFGEEGAQLVAGYAEQAFLTSGKSINEYYDSVSQITASLKRSIGDDMGEVARVADVAMQVISDNVNTFGSDAEFVENAIMGLSRNNYTMIDNLKLGYAGTAQGMLELINDSGVLGKKLTDTSQLATVGFDQMILAIQKVQEEQGIAGTTAKEALRTIEGSQKAVAKGWQNVITAIGRGEGIGKALDGLSTALFGTGEAGTGFLAQIIPRIKTTMESIGEFVVEAGPLIAEKIPEVLSAILPTVFETVTNLTASLGAFLFEKLPDIIATLYAIVGEMVQSITDFVLENLPLMLQSGVQMLNGIAQGIKSNLPAIIATAVQVVTDFLGEIIYELPDIIAAGINIVLALVEGVITSIPDILDAVGELINKVWDRLTKTDWVSIGRDIVNGIVEGIRLFGSTIGETLLGFAKDALSGIKNFFKIGSPSKLMRDEIGRWIPEGIAEGILDNQDSVFDAMAELPDVVSDGFDSENYVFENIPERTESGVELNTIISLLQQIASNGVNVTLEGDANQIFRVVRKQSINFERAKGYSAL